MDTDRNLLFAVLCLQADFIDTKQFIDVCTLWTARKSTPLAALLIEQGFISPEDKSHIDGMLQRKLAKHHDDPQASLAAVADSEVQRALAGLQDSEVQQTLTAVSRQAEHILTSTLTFNREMRERYVLSHVHASGAIGRVWLARDSDLGREVALKELLPERSQQPWLSHRFLQEAKITGQLQHPGIVPVYELARRSFDQAPFYTMRFVQGRTLTTAVREYHAKRQQGQAGSLDLNALLGAFVAVCNALAYAHARGVVHRDLKGQNIVLGDYGEVIVLDWGLAKLVGVPAEQKDMPSVRLERDAELEGTLDGQVIGTPAYMAPEQARGQLDLVDRLTDVYGLGAILFEILTGRPPHDGSGTDEVLQHIVNEETPPARSREPSVPRPLDHICSRAMAKVRSERYATAKDLAEEVKRWLADEPVQAYRESFLARCGRWGRRHKSFVSGAAALLLTSLVAAGIALVLLRAEEQKTKNEYDRAVRLREAADKERQKAEEQEQIARTQQRRAEEESRNRRKVADLLVGMFYASDPLGINSVSFYIPRAAGTSPSVAEVLSRGKEKSERELKNEPAIQATVLDAIGNVYRSLGNYDEAEKLLQQAVELRQRKYAESPLELAESLHNLAWLYHDRGSYDKAADLYRQALEIRRALPPDDPRVTDTLSIMPGS
jgi:tetratricopeptide (TPR) repeat protein/tRNA A-37 threonylcarbamoyl transferase component Bud32